MSIVPLPVFEADADPHHRSAMTDREIYERLESPETIVVRFGAMRLVGEYPYGGEAKPGCGTRLVARTHRGTEVVEMLTTTCENAGCAKSVTRQELLTFIENSGGEDFPFHSNGRILRVATIEDLNKQSALETDKTAYVRTCNQFIRELNLEMKLVDVEPILGGELLTFYYMADHRVDFRQLVKKLAAEFRTRIEMRQVGARDEARLVADYERCGQYCCCKSFLKVLKPVSMRSAKVQKATLDPLKISGRCGRLMCCLRYEDQTYSELKKKLPKRNTRVGTAEGPGIVVDGKILVQLVLVRLEHDDREIAVPVEELMDPEQCPTPEEALEAARAAADPFRGMSPADVEEKTSDGASPPERRKRRRRRRRGSKKPGDPAAQGSGTDTNSHSAAKKRRPEAAREGGGSGDQPKRRRRRRGRRRKGKRSDDGSAGHSPQRG
jgi:cell fate regulator YaaT (PSP1 superfamily)